MKNFFESFGVPKTAEIPEEVKTFEELENTRDFKLVKFDQIAGILKANKEFWRLPTVEEIASLINEKDKKFFRYKSYWAEEPDLVNGYRLVHLGGVFDRSPIVDYGDMNKDTNAGLVLYSN